MGQSPPPLDQVAPNHAAEETTPSDWLQSVKTPARADPAKAAAARGQAAPAPETTPSHPVRECAAENVAEIAAQPDLAQVHGQELHALPAPKETVQRHRAPERLNHQ